MKVINQENKCPIKMWTDGVPVENEAIDQLKNLASMPFIHKHVAVMPDVHLGKGCCIGSVVATKKAIIPAAVGVDIGCGMMAVKTNLNAKNLPTNLKDLRSKIEAAIPHGRTSYDSKVDRGSWGNIPNYVKVEWKKLNPLFMEICSKHTKLKKTNNVSHLGTLGTGNHFVEVCLDQNNSVWIMLHSGSRGIGNSIGSYFIEKAKKEMEKWFIHLPDKDLAYLPQGSELFNDYWEALNWAQSFAKTNREIMMANAISAVHGITKKDVAVVEQVVSCHHNYVEWENHFGENVLITRKGAVRARKDDWGIIPGSMGAKSFIVKGKGNKESFQSCSHGAGRKMSRSAAKKKYSIADMEHSTEGVECRKDSSVLDEIPHSYKDIDDVMEAQKDLVDIIYTLKQILCVKG